MKDWIRYQRVIWNLFEETSNQGCGHTDLQHAEWAANFLLDATCEHHKTQTPDSKLSIKNVFMK